MIKGRKASDKKLLGRGYEINELRKALIAKAADKKKDDGKDEKDDSSPTDTHVNLMKEHLDAAKKHEFDVKGHNLDTMPRRDGEGDHEKVSTLMNHKKYGDVEVTSNPEATKAEGEHGKSYGVTAESALADYKAKAEEMIALKKKEAKGLDGDDKKDEKKDAKKSLTEEVGEIAEGYAKLRK